MLASDAAAGGIAARQPAYRPGGAAERELRLEDDRFVDVTRVQLAPGAGPAALGLALHLQGRLELSERFVADPGLATTQRPAPFRHWTGARTAVCTNSVVLRVECRGRALDLTLAVPGRFTVTHAGSPDVPPRRRESLYLETTGTGTEFTPVLAAAPR